MNEVQRVHELVMQVSEFNPGAMRVCMALVDRFDGLAIVDLETMQKAGITGPEVWNLFKNACQQDLTQMHAVLMENNAVQLLSQNRYSKFYQQEAG